MDYFDDVKNHKISPLIISIFLNLLFIGSTIYFYYKYSNFECVSKGEEIVSKVDSSKTKNEEEKFIYAEVKGAVYNPGVYQVSSTSIIKDLVTLAGGFKDNAYTNNINLSHKVSDELVLYVYTKDEINIYLEENNITNDLVENICPTDSYDITDCLEEKNSEIESTNGKDNPLYDNKENTLVNINTATLEELLTISGIGESKAKAIITYRNQNGPFTSLEDIMNVSGIGEALFAKIKDYITI